MLPSLRLPLSLVLFLLFYAIPSQATEPHIQWSVPAALRVGDPTLAVSSGVSVGYRVGRFYWGIFPELAYLPAYNSIDGIISVPSLRLGLDARYYFGQSLNPWVGLGAGGMYYYANKYNEFENVSVLGEYGKVSIGATPWGERHSFGPFIAGTYGQFSYAREKGARVSLPFNKEHFDVTTGLEWQF